MAESFEETLLYKYRDYIEDVSHKTILTYVIIIQVILHISKLNNRPISTAEIDVFLDSQRTLLDETAKKKYSYWHLFASRRRAITTAAMLFSWLD